MPPYEIRAQWDRDSVRVYQAYNDEIADKALAKGRFVEPFRLSRMSWVKPSFNWMMYRSGFARKECQTRVLAIDLSREGFNWLVQSAILSHYDSTIYRSREQWSETLKDSSVRVQWDPARDWRLEVIPGFRTIQIGLSGLALYNYVNKWTLRILDVTALARVQEQAYKAGASSNSACPALLERPYFL